jgi:hypothetical protein
VAHVLGRRGPSDRLDKEALTWERKRAIAKYGLTNRPWLECASMLTLSHGESVVLSTLYDWAFAGRSIVFPFQPVDDTPRVQTFHAGVPDFLVAGELAGRGIETGAILGLLEVKALVFRLGPVEVLGPPPGQCGIIFFPSGEWRLPADRTIRVELEVDESLRRFRAVCVFVDGEAVLRRQCVSIDGVEMYGSYWLPSRNGIAALTARRRAVQRVDAPPRMGFHAIRQERSRASEIVDAHSRCCMAVAPDMSPRYPKSLGR